MALSTQQLAAIAQAVQAGPINQNVGAPQQGTRGKPSDQRFRSFAERYAIARAHNFSTDPKQLPEDQWECIMDAKRMYNMIKETGRTISPDTGEDTI